MADGHRVNDADWKTDANGYLVKIEGQWVKVPEAAVINPKDRPIDYAVVWYMKYGDRITIWCFMAGAGS